MTTPWKITPDWAGQTVAVLASGPSLSPEVVASLAKHRCIAVNYSFTLAPAADMLVALDLNPQFWDAAADFPGMRVCGVASRDLDAMYAGPRYEIIEMTPGNRIETRNSGLAAIRIAAEMGATRIILAGFDPRTPGHFTGRPAVDAEPAPGQYFGLAEGLAGLIAEMGAKDIVVEYCAAPAAPVRLRKGA